MNALERRALAARAAGVTGVEPDGGPVISGYAAVFDSQSLDLGGFVEIVRPGAFKASLASGADVKLLWDHDSQRAIASTGSGTLKLYEDGRGLRFEARPGTNRQWVRDVLEGVRAGIQTGMSFGFYVESDSWGPGPGIVRYLERVKLNEISLVSFPAYEAAGASTRREPAVIVDPLVRLAAAKRRIEIMELEG